MRIANDNIFTLNMKGLISCNIKLVPAVGAIYQDPWVKSFGHDG